MEIKEAIKILDDVIPPPDHATVDLDHLPIAQAWMVIKNELKRKKGKWLHKSKQLAALNTAWWYECSICGYHAFNGMRTDFCPNCGAEMSE